MSIELRIALIISTCVYTLVILKLIKKKEMNIRFSIFWIFTIIILSFIAVFPNVTIYFSEILGFKTPANMIFCFTIFIAFYLIFRLTLMISNEYKKTVLLIQEISILKEKIKELENAIKK